MNNDDKLREQMKSEPVPDRLKPENIKIMLDNEASKKKRGGIKLAGRIAAAAAACTVIGGTAAYTLNNGKFDKSLKTSSVLRGEQENSDNGTESASETKKQASYMSGAKDYEQIYTMFREANKKYNEKQKAYDYTLGGKNEVSAAVEEADESYAEAPMTNGEFTNAKGGGNSYGDGIFNEPDLPSVDGELPTAPETEGNTEVPQTETPTEEPTTEADPEHSETYYQEQDVLEADIVKTDGKHIYYVGNSYDESGMFHNVLRVANVKDGKFTRSFSIDLSDICGGGTTSSSVDELYIYNDMIIVIGETWSYSDEESMGTRTYAAFFTTGDEPQLIDTYQQDGCFRDVRISPEGYMLINSSYSTDAFEALRGSDDIKKYIPCCGMSEDYKAISPQDILLPEDFGTSFSLDYSIISSIDLNESGAPKEKDVKTLAGYLGDIYCSAENLYCAARQWDGYDTSTITRISIKDGNIEPQASCTINGTVKDQFSMSEYNGCFRVAASYTETKEIFHRYADDEGIIDGIWSRIKGESDGYYTYETVKKDNRVYVFDMDLNMVGSIDGLGIDEEIQSAKFSGNTAYIVTFRQTDPLYAIDLSDPSSPVVLDELKINGFSSYMQSWSEGLLLGFGSDADDDGRETGVKMTMFDNSDPNDLKALDTVTWNNEYSTYDEWEDRDGQTDKFYNSYAQWDRKALLIAPEKNIIGVPVELEEYTYHIQDQAVSNERHHTSMYVFFSFEDGKFVQKGDVTAVQDGWDYNQYHYNRAVYIGDHIYTLSVNNFVAVDINTFEKTDDLKF